VFEEGDFDNDGLDPVLMEIVDREVEDFAHCRRSGPFGQRRKRQ
jgi:hypothetical protein